MPPHRHRAARFAHHGVHHLQCPVTGFPTLAMPAYGIDFEVVSEQARRGLDATGHCIGFGC
jgi:hypothetical protein